MATWGSWIVALRNKTVSSSKLSYALSEKERSFLQVSGPSREVQTRQQRTSAPAPLTIKSIVTCRNEPRHCLFKQERQEMGFWCVTDVMRNERGEQKAGRSHIRPHIRRFSCMIISALYVSLKGTRTCYIRIVTTDH